MGDAGEFVSLQEKPVSLQGSSFKSDSCIFDMSDMFKYYKILNKIQKELNLMGRVHGPVLEKCNIQFHIVAIAENARKRMVIEMKVVLAAVAMAFPLGLLAEAPSFDGGLVVTADGEVIDVGTIASPYFYDWDGDGLKDLLVGQEEEGKIRLYLNSGSPGSPEFTDFNYMQADGVAISVPSL